MSVELTRVATRDAARRALAASRFDVVLAGSCPGLCTAELLEVVRESGQDPAVVVLSEAAEDLTAAEAIDLGAHAIVDVCSLARLGPVVRRELREARNRAALREATSSLRASEQRWLRLLEAMGLSAFTLDSDLRYDELYGWRAGCGARTERELAGTIIGTGMPEKVAARQRAAALEALSGERVELEWEDAADGEAIACRAVFTPREGLGGAAGGVIAVVRDITEDKRALGQLLMADRIGTVGMLTAGLAHELNNPLMSVIANLDLALEDVEAFGRGRPEPAAVREMGAGLQDARKAAESIRHFVRDLKLFSRVDDEKKPVDVGEVLESAIRLAWNEIKHRARLVKRFEAAPRVDANESRLGQLFLGLLVNAAQAIPEGSASANEISVSLAPGAGGTAVVEISDTGCGMSDDVVSRIFSPFFSSKPPSQGTGLGLAVGRRIVDAMGGQIEVRSVLGKGSSFRVTLPGVAQPERAAGQQACAAVSTRRGRVLVIDDDPAVAAAVRRILASRHDVVACDGLHALERIRAGDRFDVILCDLMMPELSGEEFHAKLSRLVPGMAERIVFVTGGAFTQNSAHFLQRIANPCLQKPMDIAALRQIVSERVR